MITLFNTLGRKKEEFKPIHTNKVGLYTCGPTVYNYAHIGNLKTYLFEDFLKRMFLYNGYNVKHVMNITDVGHLTSDADEGEDKMLKGAKREGKTVWEIAEFYTHAFKEDIKKLNILEPDIWCKATDHIQEMIELIKKIEANGYTYQAGGNVYFDTTKFKNYGELALLDKNELKAGARIEIDPNKKNPHDFVLWFTKSKFENQEMKWPSPWGVGYPGWHIECSAMSLKYLADQLDIHCGGVDHIGVHHTNEIAQSQAGTGKKFFNYWIHGEFMIIAGGKKMAKSEDNFLTLQNAFIKKGINPLAYRFAILQIHYRKAMEYNQTIIENAANGLANLYKEVAKLDPANEVELKEVKDNEYQKQFKEAINNDLALPEAMSIMFKLLKSDEANQVKLSLIDDFDKIFGLDIIKNACELLNKVNMALPDDVAKLIHQRDQARQQKDWTTSDQIRDELESLGYEVQDSPEGTKVNSK